jgi:hypothetical protein
MKLAVLFVLLSSIIPAARSETPIQLTGPSPFADCLLDNVALQSGTNFPGSEVEPFLAVNPGNPAHLVAVWQQDRWSNGASRGLVAGISLDSGHSWTNIILPGLTQCSGGSYQRASDPWVSFAPNGDLYASALAVNEDLPDGRNGANAILVIKSTDGGFTWTQPSVIASTANPGIFNDKETITADPTSSNHVYVVWDQLRDFPRYFTGPLMFARTTDAGKTWDPPRVIYPTGRFTQTIGAQIHVDPAGTLYCVFTRIHVLRSGRLRATICILVSADKGQTWQRRPFRVSALRSLSTFTRNGDGVYDPESLEPVRTGDILPFMAVSPVDGSLYMTWQDARFNRGARRNMSGLADDILLSVSTNGGRKWSRPVKINKTPPELSAPNRQAFTPSIAVSSNGTVAVTYYDFRANDTGPELWTDHFIVTHDPRVGSFDNPDSWTESKLTGFSFDMTAAPFARGFFVGDYVGLAAQGTGFLSLFAQPHADDSCSLFLSRYAWPTESMSPVRVFAFENFEQAAIVIRSQAHPSPVQGQ